jgi:hypothetical protein
MNKPTYTIAGQITLLKQRGMLFRDGSLYSFAELRLLSVEGLLA